MEVIHTKNINDLKSFLVDLINNTEEIINYQDCDYDSGLENGRMELAQEILSHINSIIDNTI